ncbi:hypothetical protein KBY58_11490 [Cyanobium sp. HWJ4-Hawea]|uniref:hypothetical protein n=1 Tax=Cyanobium sp. HWJ4-Hawea TaxID=2823713 RepID=UPI0020CC80C3|nr:hypothetical protein [Cyanobium sp. HWJ4-Hawea]MCP9810057.1 hypothetical protein [Cyanobium sp. HWJ4-Hawea]
MKLIYISWAPLAIGIASLSTPSFGGDNLDIETINKTNFVKPAEMIKITVTTPNSSNRIEANHFQPVNKTKKSLTFFDNTIFIKARPLNEAGESNSELQSWGNTLRLGHRSLINEGKSYIGFNAGYDNTFKDSYYYQQLGIGFEFIHPGITVLATGNYPIGKSSYKSPGQEVESTFNLQASVPLWDSNFSITTRIYYIVENQGGSAPGGLGELTYSFNSKCSLTYTVSNDRLSGTGYVLQLKYLFNPPNKNEIPSGMPYGTALPFSQALGNTGSRIIRLSGSVPAYGN